MRLGVLERRLRAQRGYLRTSECVAGGRCTEIQLRWRDCSEHESTTGVHWFNLVNTHTHSASSEYTDRQTTDSSARDLPHASQRLVVGGCGHIRLRAVVKQRLGLRDPAKKESDSVKTRAPLAAEVSNDSGERGGSEVTGGFHGSCPLWPPGAPVEKAVSRRLLQNLTTKMVATSYCTAAVPGCGIYSSWGREGCVRTAAAAALLRASRLRSSLWRLSRSRSAF